MGPSHTHRRYSLADRHVAVHLLCLPQAEVASVFNSLPPDATPEDIAAALWNIKPIWPAEGQLVVQLNFAAEGNDKCVHGRAWLPAHLVSDTMAVRDGALTLTRNAEICDRPSGYDALDLSWKEQD